MGSEKTVRLTKQKAPVAAASDASRAPSKPQRLEKGEQSRTKSGRKHRPRTDSETDASEASVFGTDSEGATGSDYSSAESSSSYSSSDTEEGRRMRRKETQKKSQHRSYSSSSESESSSDDDASESAFDSDDDDMGSSRRRRRHIQRH